jgi:hypothetical protein
MMQTGMAWLDSQRKAHMGLSVVYRRGADSVTLTATPGRTNYQTSTEDGAIIETKARDYLISRADLILDGQEVEPAVGDIIEEVVGDRTYMHAVTENEGAKCFEFSDEYRTTLRIHTKWTAKPVNA